MIEKEKEYTLYEILRDKLMPKYTNIITLRNLISSDSMGENILETRKVKVGLGIKYQIKGSNIIKFLKIHERPR